MSKNINEVTVVGRLVKNVDLQYTQTGTAYANFAIACNDQEKQPDGNWADVANFFDCVMFGTYIEAIAKYMTKGSPIAIQGKLKQQRWEDKQTGTARSKVVIMVKGVDFFNSTSEKQSNNNGYPPPQNKNQARPNPQGNRANHSPNQSYQQNGNNYRPPEPTQPQLSQGGYPGPEQFDDDIPF